jgi:hypothetical protein
MTVSPWYRWEDMPPPYTVMTRWQWAGRIFVGIRSKHPKSGREIFTDARTSERVDLSRQKYDEDGSPYWVDLVPELWQPLKPELWRAPLPAPVVLSTAGILATEQQSFNAAEAAREMEADRHHANSVSRETPDDAKRWWRDISNIKYEPAGDVTLKMVEGRVMRALAFCGAGRGLTLTSVTACQVLAAAVEAHDKAVSDSVEAIVNRLQPLPADHSDFETAMGWFVALNPPELWHKRRMAWALSKMQRVLLLRSFDVPLSYEAIGRECGWKGHQRATQVYAEAVDKCWRAANGMQVHKHLMVSDQIAALRERNRAAKRGTPA